MRAGFFVLILILFVWVRLSKSDALNFEEQRARKHGCKLTLRTNFLASPPTPRYVSVVVIVGLEFI